MSLNSLESDSSLNGYTELFLNITLNKFINVSILTKKMKIVSPLPPPEGRYQGIDSLKFIFSLIIVYFHLLHSNMKGCIGKTEVFNYLSKSCVNSGLIVEAFLIIAGYFIFKASLNQRNTISSFILSRFARLWPVMVFYILSIFLLARYPLEDAIHDLFFLRATGLSMNHTGIIWYVSPFFWGSILVFSLLRIFDYKKALLLIAILTYFTYTINIHNLGGGVGRHVVYSWCSLGFFRVVGGLGVGVLIGALSNLCCRACSNTRFVIFSVLELVTLGLITWNLLVMDLFENSVTTVVLFAIYIYVQVSGGGILYRALSWAPLAKMGKYCYSIYVMQPVAFLCMSKTIWAWRKDFWLSEPVIALALSTIIAVLIGIITFYLVEQPCGSLYKRWKMRCS